MAHGTPLIPPGALEASVGTKVTYKRVKQRRELKRLLRMLVADLIVAAPFFVMLHWLSWEAAAFYAFLTIIARQRQQPHGLPQRPLIVVHDHKKKFLDALSKTPKQER